MKVDVRKTVFDLATNNIVSLSLQDEKLESQDIIEIVKAATKSKVLKEFNLSGNNINSAAATALIELIARTRSLIYLNLANNNLPNLTIDRIVYGLLKNKTIHSLDLSGNNGNSKLANAVGMVLKENSFLTHLFMSNNSIGLEGQITIASALERNNSLFILDLSNNNITSSGFNCWVKCLQKNTSLCQLNLSNNPLDDDGAKYLLEGLRSNRTICCIDLSGTKISPKLIGEIYNIALGNHLIIDQLARDIYDHHYYPGLPPGENPYSIEFYEKFVGRQQIVKYFVADLISKSFPHLDAISETMKLIKDIEDYFRQYRNTNLEPTASPEDKFTDYSPTPTNSRTLISSISYVERYESEKQSKPYNYQVRGA